MDSTTVAIGAAFLVALALYMMKRRGRSNRD
jgi:hypothetical protein